MTVSEVVVKLRRAVDDGDSVNFSNEDLLDSIQDNSYLVSILTGVLNSSARLNYVANAPYYDLASLIPSFFSVLAVYDEVNKHFIPYSTLSAILRTGQTPELDLGLPKCFTIVDTRKILLYPNPGSAAGTFKVFYRKYSEPIDINSTLDFAGMDYKAMEYLTLMDLNLQLQELTEVELNRACSFDSINNVIGSSFETMFGGVKRLYYGE